MIPQEAEAPPTTEAPHPPETRTEDELFTNGEWEELVSDLRLTGRQAEVVRLILRGQNDHEIATALGIARPTVRVHVRRAFEAVGVTDRTTLVIAVFRAYRRRAAVRERQDEAQ